MTKLAWLGLVAFVACTPDDFVDEDSLCDFCPDVYCPGRTQEGACNASGKCLQAADVCPARMGGEGGMEPGQGGGGSGGAGGEGGAGAAGGGGEAGAPSCDSCSEWDGGDPSGLCAGSQALAEAILDCVCVLDCASACGDNLCGGGSSSAECDECFVTSCMDELDACAADE
jgi:hypothetical protein